MKRRLFITLIICVLFSVAQAQECRRYALIWNDEFNSGILDETVWSKIKRSKSAWAVHMSPADTLYAFADGDLVLRGMKNDFIPTDKAEYLTGGIWSKYRKTFGFGKVEVRAKFDVAMGYWPAIWMLPQVNKDLNWPYGGEIDIMEHFQESSSVNQTIHSDYTVYQRRGNRPAHVAYPKYNEGDYNTYAMERFQDSLVFFVNGERTFCYPRYRKGNDGQFPFSQHDYYLILDSQIGHDGSPYIDTAKLPVELRIDYVRYYELDTKTDVVPEPKDFQVIKERKKRLRKVVYDKKTRFDNPDEYRLVIKCGKATISGNRQWAESTLVQLVDENGRVPNLEVHDWAACPYRGIALDSKSCRMSYDAMVKLLDKMAFCKLNYLKWDGKGSCSTEEINMLKEYAHGLGVTMVSAPMGISGLDALQSEGRPPASFSNRVFLQKAATSGGILTLENVNDAMMDVLLAFSERYWRGDNAGEGVNKTYSPDVLTPAGTRLVNFKERMAIAKTRFHKKQ